MHQKYKQHTSHISWIYSTVILEGLKDLWKGSAMYLSPNGSNFNTEKV